MDRPAEISGPVSTDLEGPVTSRNRVTSGNRLAPASWRVVGAVVRGVAHERRGLPCQDAQDYRLLPDGTLLVAVADGAGSASFSDQGARLAVNQALHTLSDQLSEPPGTLGWEELVSAGFSAAREAILNLAAKAVEEPAGSKTLPVDSTGGIEFLAEDGVASSDADTAGEAGDVLQETAASPADNIPAGVPARRFATTLTCVIATAEQLVVGQVGDGAVVAGQVGELFAVTHLQRGEYANETHFLTQPDALDHLDIEVIERPVDALAVMSDGLIRLALKMPAQEPHAPFFQPLFRSVATVTDEAAAAQQLSAFLGSERVNARTDDDKSLILAVRAGRESTADPRESVDDAQRIERTMDETSAPGAA